MSEAEIVQYFSYLFGSYAIGWCSGALIRFFIKLSEYI